MPGPGVVLQSIRSQSVPVSLGPRADPFLGWDLDIGLSWILQVFVPLATESSLIIASVRISFEVQGNRQ